MFYEVRQGRPTCRENILGNPKSVKMVQKHTQNFCKFFIAWIKKKSIPFSTSTPRVQRVTGCASHTDVRSSSSVLHKPNSFYRTRNQPTVRKTPIKAGITRRVPFSYASLPLMEFIHPNLQSSLNPLTLTGHFPVKSGLKSVFFFLYIF